MARRPRGAHAAEPGTLTAGPPRRRRACARRAVPAPFPGGPSRRCRRGFARGLTRARNGRNAAGFFTIKGVFSPCMTEITLADTWDDCTVSQVTHPPWPESCTQCNKLRSAENKVATVAAPARGGICAAEG